MRASVAFDPERLIAVLSRHRVDFVLIGALAARLQGFSRLTADADITPRVSVANLERLAAALRELEARVFTEGVPRGLAFDCTATTLSRAEMWNLITNAGRLDIAFHPSGTTGFSDLAKTAVRFEISGDTVLVADIAAIIRSKEASGRPKDHQDVAILREILRRRSARDSE